MNDVAHRWIHNSPLGLVAAFAFFSCAAKVFAAGHNVTAAVSQAPLSASIDSNVIRTLDQLRKDAAEKGAVRIIVGLRVSFVPEGMLDSARVTQQRDEIARIQSLVLEKIPSLKQRPEKTNRFGSIPFMALEVNSTELETLASLPEVASIQEDKVLAPAMGDGLVVPKNK